MKRKGAVLLVKAGRSFYKVRVNPLPEKDPFSTKVEEQYDQLCGAYVRQIRRGRLASAVRIERQILKFEHDHKDLFKRPSRG